MSLAAPLSATSDLELARALLIAEKDLTLVAVRGDEVITSTESGIRPVLEWVREGRDLTGFSVADKIVGKAPALLYAALGPTAVFSPVMSWTARAVLLCAGIATSYDQLVPHIQNHAKDGQCPMDAAVTDVFDPYEAVRVLGEKVRSLFGADAGASLA